MASSIIPNKCTLLWTNPSPSSEMSTTSINLDLSKYNFILIEYVLKTTNLSYKKTEVYKVSENSTQIVYGTNWDGNDNYYAGRSIFINLNRIDIRTAYYFPNYSKAVEVNNYLVPYKIYGIN